MQGAAWIWRRAACVFALLALAACGFAAPGAQAAARAKTPAKPSIAKQFAWASSSIRSTQAAGFLPAALAAQPQHVVSRRQYAEALARFDAQWSAQQGVPGVLAQLTTGKALTDVPQTSIFAKEVQLGWIAPMGHTFDGAGPITGDTAAVGIVGALGLRSEQYQFAVALKAALPGVRINYASAAAQVFVRTLGLRYNNLQGTETQEVGPSDPMRVAHVAYLLSHAANLTDWQLGGLADYTTFSLPALGPNQRTVLDTAVAQVGQPYVWGGTTEGAQPQGHGGFDCSGLVWRAVWHSGLADTALDPIKGRTSEQMSADMTTRARILNPVKLQPADVLFWGYEGAKSKPTDNYHAAIYMGNGWFIQSDGANDGVSIDRLADWYLTDFSWGRRVLHTP